MRLFAIKNNSIKLPQKLLPLLVQLFPQLLFTKLGFICSPNLTALLFHN